jgi:exopolysaccharide production protein ExoY
LMAVVAALVYCFEGGPVIFSQERIGLDGGTFRILKFRTMTVNADNALKEVLSRDKVLSGEWSERQKMQHDPRVTALGRVLRLSSVDELPQLFNVLKGEMSLVGPRPIVAEETIRYGRYLGRYCSVRPGLTGLWQVRRNSDTTYRRRVALDVVYSRRTGLFLDLLILLRTVPAVLSGLVRYEGEPWH